MVTCLLSHLLHRHLVAVQWGPSGGKSCTDMAVGARDVFSQLWDDVINRSGEWWGARRCISSCWGVSVVVQCGYGAPWQELSHSILILTLPQ